MDVLYSEIPWNLLFAYYLFSLCIIIAEEDYTAINENHFPLSLLSDDNRRDCLIIAIISDDVQEEGEYFYLDLSLYTEFGLQNDTLINIATTQINIIDGDGKVEKKIISTCQIVYFTHN